MAEAPLSINNINEKSDQEEKVLEGLECAVCLQPCVHPSELPCGHIFCFLCIKGMANQSKRCAMCRQEIPRRFLDHPKLLQPPDYTESYDDGYQWFYEGRNGWWQYDKRTSKELELSYKGGEKVCELLIAGLLYIVDLGSMIQIRKNDPLRRRRVKRDLAMIPKKGVAGLRTNSDIIDCADYEENQRSFSPVDGNVENLMPITPTNTPQTPISGQESPQTDDLETTIERMSNVRLDVNDNRHISYLLNNEIDEESG